MSPARALLLLAVLAAPASAQIANLTGPDPTTSAVDGAVVVCPAGDIPFHLTLRDMGIAPRPGSTVTLDFATAKLSLCPATRDAGYGRQERVLFAVSGQGGLLAFRIRGGGAAAGDSVVVQADGQAFGSRPVLSPDLDGDLDVDRQDVTLASSQLGRDGTADLDRDGTVTKADIRLLRAHLGHACDAGRPSGRGPSSRSGR
jgi:hypothetical protein